MSLAAESNELDAKHRVLKDTFGFDGFRPGQEPVIDALLAGRHVLTVMPTGMGKSLCYQLPALVLGGLTLVVSPLVALMRDQVAALRLAGVAAEAINSSRSREDNVATWRRVQAGEVRILYMAPERLRGETLEFDLVDAEGTVVAAFGALVGVALGMGYAWLMLAGLRSWWVGAIVTPFS